MKLNDWIYLIEFAVKRKDTDAAETFIAAMKKDDELTRLALAYDNRINHPTR